MNLLKKPYKCPLPNYVKNSSSKSLGIKRVEQKLPLHDPHAPDALVLYWPKEEAKTAKILQTDSKASKIDVAVVVDPILSSILRPHQREGVKFMYDAVTGIKSKENINISYFYLISNSQVLKLSFYRANSNLWFLYFLANIVFIFAL